MEVKGKELFSIIAPLAKWSSKGKEQLITLNNTSRWHKFSHAKIKNQYKELLKDYYFPEPKDKYETLHIEYQVLRHNKRRLDADGLSWSYKWAKDTLVDIGWLYDDDKVHYCVVPAKFKEGLTETQIKITVSEVIDE